MTFNFNKNEFNIFLESNNKAILYKKISSDQITPVLAARRIFEKFPDYNLLLESAQNNKDGKNSKGRFSVIAFDPDVVWKCENGASEINLDFYKDRNNFVKKNDDVIQSFRDFFNSSKIDFSKFSYNNSEMPSICAGIFGYFGYDMVNFFEKISNGKQVDEINIPDSIFIRPQVIVVFDNFYDCALICCPLYGNKENDYDYLENKINLVEDVIKNGEFTKIKNIKTTDFSFKSSHTKDEYCKIVDHCKNFIVNGDIFQILPSQRFTCDYIEDEFLFYRSLRSLNPSPFLFYLKFNDFVLTGSSPEIMVSLKNNKVTIRPLAGTRPRGINIQEDRAIAKNLLSDEKEVAEHLMLIDLGRHDVGRVCKPSTVVTTEKMVIEFYSHVMHISSNVEGEIRDELDAIDALISGFPAGTVSGAPKIRAMQILSEIENLKRAFYAGCVGYFSANGEMETCITLRSALIKNDKIYIQSGAGVVFDSNAESEHDECINKASALILACKKINEFLD